MGYRFGFEVQGLRISLVYATLSFTLTIGNRSEHVLPPARLHGDMISAHASLPRDIQLAPALSQLPPLRDIPQLAPGEECALRCDVQLALSAIVPLRQGNAQFLVPLLRLALVTPDGIWQRLVLTVGAPGGASGAAPPSSGDEPDAASPLIPLRLDTGPQTFTVLGASVVETSRHMPLDPVLAAG